ncbi:leucine Rich repeat-containing domain protein [Trichuris suis]|nr:leucine Rich repeat-containing domain protein [Trichuris suis]
MHNLSIWRGALVGTLFYLIILLDAAIGQACPGHIPSECNCRNYPAGISVHCNQVDIATVVKALDKPDIVVDKLKIENSNIPTLSAGALSSLKVKRLDLSGNGIQKIEKDAFGNGATNIVELLLANNALKELPDVSSLAALQILNINGNQLEDIKEDAFANNPTLRVLKARSNRICTLSSNSLYDVKSSLEMLDLSKNCLTQVPAPNLRGSQNLAIVDLSENAIESLPNLQFMNMPELRDLRLGNNEIEEVLPLAFMNVPKLESLNLTKNKLATLETSRFMLFENLQLLDLSSNKLTKLPASAFKELAVLKELHLNDNLISIVETMAISNNPQLRLINLANNSIRELYFNAFDQLDGLETLFLGGNKIATIEKDMLAGMPNLKQLSLRANELTKIETSAFDNVPLLTTLDLASNRIASLQNGVFDKLADLFWLDLSNNQLSTIQEGTFKNGIPNLLLQRNPLRCDESITWLIKYISSEKVRSFFPGEPDVTCDSPPEMAGKPLRSMMISEANKTMTGRQENSGDELIGGDLVDQLFHDAQLARSGEKNASVSSLFPALDHLSSPLAKLFESQQSNQNLKDLLAKLQEIFKNFPAASQLRNMSPQMINYILRGGQIPGIPPALLKRLVENYARSLVSDRNALGMKGLPLPPMSSLPPEMIENVLQGKPVLGLTAQETLILRERYIKQLIGPNSTLESISSMLPKDMRSPLTNLTKGGTLMGLTMEDLQNIDLNSIPTPVLVDLVTGKTPDFTQVPVDLVRLIMNRNPTLFGELVSKQLNKSNQGRRPSKGGRTSPEEAPYDVSHLDRKGNLKMFNEHRGSQMNSELLTGIALGVVALLTVLATIILCYRRVKKNRITEAAKKTAQFTAPLNSSLQHGLSTMKCGGQSFHSLPNSSACMYSSQCQCNSSCDDASSTARIWNQSANYYRPKQSGINV